MKKILAGFFVLCFCNLFSLTRQDSWKDFYDQSFHYLYNCEYDKAFEYLNKAQELNPTSPLIYWRLTYAVCFELLYEQGLDRNATSKLKDIFDQAFHTGIELCSSNNSSPESLFCLGGLYGNYAIFKQAIGKRSKSMLSDVKECRQYLEKIKDIDNFYYDACGYLGIFNYISKFMSWLEKRTAQLVGYKWDEAKGLKQIRDAIEYSKYSDDTKFLYVGILMELVKDKKHKNRIQEAVDLINELIKKYPNNSFLEKNLKTLSKISEK